MGLRRKLSNTWLVTAGVCFGGVVVGVWVGSWWVAQVAAAATTGAVFVAGWVRFRGPRDPGSMTRLR